ncbi:MAG: DUF5024 domain-containing protein [Tannerella sp.]|nr:DUF5024 domain-containing protein [Tannerella sp.]
MKVTKRWMAVMVLLLVGGAWMGLAAQETIDALVKKCESLNDVNVSIMRNRDPETKEITKSIVTIVIPAQSNQALIDGFVAAFQKEKENAEQEIENRKDGKMVNLFYRFKKKTYSLTIDHDEKNVVVSIIENESKGEQEQRKHEQAQRKKEQEQRK